MMFAQRRNRLTAHFSDPIPVVKRRISDILASNGDIFTVVIATRKVNHVSFQPPSDRLLVAFKVNVEQRRRWEMLQQPPCSPDLSLSDYELTPRLKQALRGKRFGNRDDMLTHSLP